MNLTFLGTSAANAYPDAFCCCDHCEQARTLGGPSLRKRAAALINDDLLIDLGPDIMTASSLHQCRLTNVRYCLQTHGHADHLDASHLLSRSPEYGVVGAPRLHWYASAATLRIADDLLAADLAPGTLLDPAVAERLNLVLYPVSPLQPFTVGPYRVIAVPAVHDPRVEPLLYIITHDKRCIFYGTDTAELPEPIWQTFHQLGLRFDLVVLDHTYGPDVAADDHLNALQVAHYAERLRAEGLLRETGRVLGTHLSHDGTPPHPAMAAYAAYHGYEIAYDGLRIELNA